MRLAKLSTDEFADTSALDTFFSGLPRRTPPGLFLVRNQIAADGLFPEETILFSLSGRVSFVGKVQSGRQPNSFEQQEAFPYCIIVEPTSIQRVDVSLAELERRLNVAGVHISLGGQGWTKLPDSPEAEAVVKALLADNEAA
jgi:hypothetical protein